MKKKETNNKLSPAPVFPSGWRESDGEDVRKRGSPGERIVIVVIIMIVVVVVVVVVTIIIIIVIVIIITIIIIILIAILRIVQY